MRDKVNADDTCFLVALFLISTPNLRSGVLFFGGAPKCVSARVEKERLIAGYSTPRLQSYFVLFILFLIVRD